MKYLGKLGLTILMGGLWSCQVAPPGTVLEGTPPNGSSASAQARAAVSVAQSQCGTYWLATESLCAELQWIEVPAPQTPTGEFVLRFYHLEDDSGVRKLVDPRQEPFVKLWMVMEKMPPHGSTPVRLERESTGIWRARGVHFVMSGQWQIWVQLRDLDKKVLDQARGAIQVRSQ